MRVYKNKRYCSFQQHNNNQKQTTTRQQLNYELLLQLPNYYFNDQLL
ncbi:MAG: hypothetical protein QOF46_3072, partial [Paraburkholderia sp.]|nr:hypothetical protein [Paraburkholderia sp.]